MLGVDDVVQNKTLERMLMYVKDLADSIYICEHFVDSMLLAVVNLSTSKM